MRHLAVVVLLACASMAPAARSQDAGPGIVTVITSPEPQSQLMALILTAQARQQGAGAHILLCGPGGDLALDEPPAAATAPQPPRDQSPQGLLRLLVEAGATAEVCALYLPGKRLDPEALIEGVGVAQPPDMAAAMLAPNTRLLTF